MRSSKWWLPGAVLLILTLIAPRIARADTEPAIEITHPPQVVEIGINAVLYSGNVLLSATGPTIRADGMLALQSRSGETAMLQIIFARRLRQSIVRQGKPLLIVAEDIEADPLSPPIERLVVGLVSREGPGLDRLDLVGTDLLGEGNDRIRFVVDSNRRRAAHAFPTHDFGQLPTSVLVFSPLQTVQPINSDTPLEFAAAAAISRDQVARGVVLAPLSDQGDQYELCFGAVFPHVVLGVQLLMVGVLPDASHSDALLRATVEPAAANPDCQIWDLVNGSTGQIPVRRRAIFDAETALVFP